jgi:hypothetical protein
LRRRRSQALIDHPERDIPARSVWRGLIIDRLEHLPL